MPRFIALILSVCFLFTLGCSKAYYSGMEKLGYDKRDILSDRVENARESQQEAKEQFASALDRYKSVINFDGGELEEKYKTLKDEYEDCESQAEDVRDHIASVEDVAQALFTEWADEINQYTNTKLKADSKKKLTATKRSYAKLIKAMKRASAKMDPVLAAFKDQVLYLKHNLNAKAVASLEGELTSIRSNVDRLIKEMESSIAEADSFIKTLQ
ncbi:DUF2959 domain-containing protein [Pseudodesulfovibrio sp.]|uniref:DUF2959 domain-containing protein n=1 Tax=unclassified Pseudodesulfovibrio TaxID=2661612 RepID=UPI003AFFEFC9